MEHEDDNRPAWAARFLAALRAGNGTREACRVAGVTSSTPYHLRGRDEAFRREWDACAPVDGRRKRRAQPAAPRESKRMAQFIAELAATSNVAAAAAVAGIPVSRVYRLRRMDPEFQRQWFAALAEGYDNLEMDVLARLREGRFEDVDADGTRRKFDIASALRCLSAHRENVAREKGRRTLAEEVTTIEAINAKIDSLRAQAKKGEASIRKARKNVAKKDGDDGAA